MEKTSTPDYDRVIGGGAGFPFMVIELAFYRCFFCGHRFPVDPEAKGGRFIHDWKVAVCLRCLAGNREGVPKTHPVIKQLAERGLVVHSDTSEIVPWPGEEALPAASVPDAEVNG